MKGNVATRIVCLELLLGIAIVDPAESNRELAIKTLSEAFEDCDLRLKGGYVKENRFMLIVNDGQKNIHAELGELPSCYGGKNIEKAYAFEI